MPVFTQRGHGLGGAIRPSPERPGESPFASGPVDRALARAVENLANRQEARGCWAGDYGGPMFLLPMYVGLTHAAGRPIDERRRARMLAYFTSAQREDGSLG